MEGQEKEREEKQVGRGGERGEWRGERGGGREEEEEGRKERKEG